MDAASADRWTIALEDCGLVPGVYHYLFEVTDGRPGQGTTRVRCTDRAAWTVDWRLFERAGDVTYPAAVAMVRDGRLMPCDADRRQPVRARVDVRHDELLRPRPRARHARRRARPDPGE